MKLYGYWRSSASYRVRIVLNLHGTPYEQIAINLAQGAQWEERFMALNPAGAVPVLELSTGERLTQSLAIIRYLEATQQQSLLWPTDPLISARMEASAQVIASDTHPIANLRVLKRIEAIGAGKDRVKAWVQHWIRQGLENYMALIEPGMLYSFGNTPSLADVCLIPQLYNARRWQVDLSGLERLSEIDAACGEIKAFQDAHPDIQFDAPKGP